MQILVDADACPVKQISEGHRQRSQGCQSERIGFHGRQYR